MINSITSSTSISWACRLGFLAGCWRNDDEDFEIEDDEELDDADDEVWIAEDDAASHSRRISSHFCAPVFTNSSCLWEDEEEESETNNSSSVEGGSGFLFSLSLSTGPRTCLADNSFIAALMVAVCCGVGIGVDLTCVTMTMAWMEWLLKLRQ